MVMLGIRNPSTAPGRKVPWSTAPPRSPGCDPCCAVVSGTSPARASHGMRLAGMLPSSARPVWPKEKKDARRHGPPPPPLALPPGQAGTVRLRRRLVAAAGVRVPPSSSDAGAASGPPEVWLPLPLSSSAMGAVPSLGATANPLAPLGWPRSHNANQSPWREANHRSRCMLSSHGLAHAVTMDEARPTTCRAAGLVDRMA
mmetsp:Transcript_77596/g.240420  ORF Transcript_77596/g.240420 Transcript_77596/m.240420 type:complete len:200 (-) Transcript_77596:8-607(-)